MQNERPTQGSPKTVSTHETQPLSQHPTSVVFNNENLRLWLLDLYSYSFPIKHSTRLETVLPCIRHAFSLCACIDPWSFSAAPTAILSTKHSDKKQLSLIRSGVRHTPVPAALPAKQPPASLMSDMSTWDPAGVVARAKELIHSSNVRIRLTPFVFPISSCSARLPAPPIAGAPSDSPLTVAFSCGFPYFLV
jgi:hypothetical protein